MTRLPLLRAAVLAAVALFPVTAFIGGCDSGQPGSTTTPAPPQSTSTGVPKKTRSQRLTLVAPPHGTAQQKAPQPDAQREALKLDERQRQGRQPEGPPAQRKALKLDERQRQGLQPEGPPAQQKALKLDARQSQGRQPEGPQSQGGQPDAQRKAPPADAPEEAFCSASTERECRYMAKQGGSCGRLRGWPAEFTEAVRIFLASQNASWTPRAIKALRDEVYALASMAHYARLTLEMDNLSPETQRMCESDLSVLAEFEEMHSGLLKKEPVEMDNGEPKTCPSNAGELGDAAKEFQSRRKCRLDQLALRSNGKFGELLPAASVETCDRLSELDSDDVARAENLVSQYKNSDPSPGDGLADLIQFVRDEAAAKKIGHTRTRLASRLTE